MEPILFEFGPVTVYTYGLLVATGFLAGIGWAARLAKREGMDPQAVYDTGFWIIFSAIVGSRIFYILMNYEHFLQNPLGIFKLWEGGLVFYGGLFGACVAVAICVKRYNLDLWKFADVAAPGAALGHSIGRLGCLFAGCCYGLQTDVPWAITFYDVHSIAPTGVPLHPTQLYSAANEFTLFILLTLMRPHRKFYGQVWWLWVGMYAIGRSIVEIYRGDPRGALLDGLVSTSQIVAAVAFTIAVIFYFRNRSNKAMLVEK